MVLVGARFLIELRQLLHKDFIELLRSKVWAGYLVWIDQALVDPLVIDQPLIELVSRIPLIQEVPAQPLLEPHEFLLGDSIVNHVFQLIFVAGALHFVVVAEEAGVAVVHDQGFLWVAILDC